MVGITEYIGVNTSVSKTEMEGETVIRVVKSKKINEYDENTYAKAVGVDFQNGTIEVDMLSRLLPDAPEFARGFIGIAFRVAEDDNRFESFYIRPTNSIGATDDPVRQAHGCQYFSYPGYTFAYFRENGIMEYEAPIRYGLNRWVHLKAVIDGADAAFYLNNEGSPVLKVHGMFHGDKTHGSIGLFVDIGTEGFFKNLTIKEGMKMPAQPA